MGVISMDVVVSMGTYKTTMTTTMEGVSMDVVPIDTTLGEQVL